MAGFLELGEEGCNCIITKRRKLDTTRKPAWEAKQNYTKVVTKTHARPVYSQFQILMKLKSDRQ